MRAFGRDVSKWWLLLVAALVILGVPMLLGLFFLGNNLAGAILGPPAIWNRPSHSPGRDELAGRYVETKRNWDREQKGPDAMLDLKIDGTMTVSNLPEDDIDSTCNVSGSGSWGGPDENMRIDLIVTSVAGPASCAPDTYPLMEIAGHSKPYKLYWVLGDPDSGTGVWLKRQ